MAKTSSNASSGHGLPKAPIDTVKIDSSIMVYPPFDKMDIGANASGLPSGLQGPNSIEHVGSSAGKGRSK